MKEASVREVAHAAKRAYEARVQLESAEKVLGALINQMPALQQGIAHGRYVMDEDRTVWRIQRDNDGLKVWPESVLDVLDDKKEE